MLEYDDLSSEDLTVRTLKGEIICMLNIRLIKSQKIDRLTIDLIKETHQMKHLIFVACEQTSNTEQLKKLAGMLEKLEFYQQELWGFPPNVDYHQWFAIPGCTCSISINDVANGTPLRHYSLNCKIHGDRHAIH